MSGAVGGFNPKMLESRSHVERPFTLAAMAKWSTNNKRSQHPVNCGGGEKRYARARSFGHDVNEATEIGFIPVAQGAVTAPAHRRRLGLAAPQRRPDLLNTSSQRNTPSGVS
jgi:hypothetical protein